MGVFEQRRRGEVTPDQVTVVTVSGKSKQVVSIEQSVGYMRVVIKDEEKTTPGEK